MHRLNTFTQLEEMIEQMHRSMIGSDSFGAGNQQRLRSGTDPSSVQESSVNLIAEPVDGEYIVTADLPGFEKDEIDLRFEENILTISGAQDRSEETNDGVGAFAHGQQRHTYEQVHIPVTIDKDAISASYRNGVLEVRLPFYDDSDDDSSRIEIQ
jgi:HSP20 family protein